MNDRLEIASRLMADMVNFRGGTWEELRRSVLEQADALIAEEARTRAKAEPAPDELRAVAEELMQAATLLHLHVMERWDEYDRLAYRLGAPRTGEPTDWGNTYCNTALRRARAMGLGGGE